MRVALHPEGVDRNIALSRRHLSAVVALHPEGVDRNHVLNSLFVFEVVALHPEGVDRNLYILAISEKYASSPSTRRAWIEITPRAYTGGMLMVALHPEGVDRNSVFFDGVYQKCFCRPPPGGRG